MAGFNPYSAPRTRQISDGQGSVTDDYYNFFGAMAFVQGAAIPDLADGATLADVISTVNSILAVLRAQGRIAS